MTMSVLETFGPSLDLKVNRPTYFCDRLLVPRSKRHASPSRRRWVRWVETAVFFFFNSGRFGLAWLAYFLHELLEHLTNLGHIFLMFRWYGTLIIFRGLRPKPSLPSSVRTPRHGTGFKVTGCCVLDDHGMNW